MTPALVVLAGLLFAGPAFAQRSGGIASDTWSGYAECYISVFAPGYTSTQRHTWSFNESPPTPVGNDGTYRHLARWSVTGDGSFQRASGPPLKWLIQVSAVDAPLTIYEFTTIDIKSAHTPLSAPNALVARPQTTGTAPPAASDVIYQPVAEWPFPMIQDPYMTFPPTGGVAVRGSSSSFLTQKLDGFQPDGAQGTANCTWQFVNQKTLPPAPTSANTPPANPTPSANGLPPPPPPNNASGTGGTVQLSPEALANLRAGRADKAAAPPANIVTPDRSDRASVAGGRGLSGFIVPESSTGSWSGWAQCTISLKATDYADEVTHTWILTGGPPKPESSVIMGYPATWTVTGSGHRDVRTPEQHDVWSYQVSMSAPISIWITPGGKLRITRRAALSNPKGLVGVSSIPTLTGSPKKSELAYAVSEWPFPVPEVAPSNAVAGSPPASATNQRFFAIQPAGSTGLVECSWAFTNGDGTTQSSGTKTGTAKDGTSAATDVSRRNSDVNRANVGGILGTAGQTTPAAGAGNNTQSINNPNGAVAVANAGNGNPNAGTANAGTANIGTANANNANSRNPGTSPTNPTTGGGAELSSLTPACTAPGPKALTTEKLTPGGITLNWAPPDANPQIRYTVSRQDLGTVTPQPLNDWRFSHSAALNYRQTYQYGVTAHYGDGRCGSTIVTITPPKPHEVSYSVRGVTGALGQATGGVRLQWGVEGDEPSGFLVLGAGLPENGVEVPAAPQPGQGGPFLAIDRLPAGTHTWLIIPFWNTGTGMMRDASTATRATTTLGRYRVVINGLRVNHETSVDQFNSDGEHDEVYVAAKVVKFGGYSYNGAITYDTTGVPLATVKSKTHGDVSRWITRVQAGTVTNSGGIQSGDTLPWGVGDPSQPYNRPPSRETFPLLLCECWLTETDHLEIEPTLWQENNRHDHYDLWEQGRPLPPGIRAENGLDMWLNNLRIDVPIGDVAPARKITVRPADIDRGVSGGVNLPAGTFSVRFQGGVLLGYGDYEMYVRVERVP